MNQLSEKDKCHINAARGWLELGNCIEANRELECVTAAFRIHPDVLEVRWQIFALNKMWTAAFEIATAICELDPDRPSGWIHQAYSLNEMAHTEKACDILRNVADKFSHLPIISYCLACYTCRLNNPAEAWPWLEKAIEKGDGDNIVRLALKEPDLKPLWKRLKAKLAAGRKVGGFTRRPGASNIAKPRFQKAVRTAPLPRATRPRL
ncbi:MAG: tetratricopeptide repeat protein [Verrucomicrobia bacterium]|nr:tetratricopeptide repeat protein [Verrucomicrobiota bacterium]